MTDPTTPFTYDYATFLQRIIELNINDPRCKSMVVYPLFIVYAIHIMAKMAGCNNATAVKLWWEQNNAELQKLFYGLDDVVPSEQTIRRLITCANNDEILKFLQDYFTQYRFNTSAASGAVPLIERDVISADGQNIRATRLTKEENDARKSSGYDLVSLYSAKYGFTLSQRTVDKKNQEAKAIVEMLDELNLRNCILAWDAINTRVSTLEAVIKAEADFVVSLKSNQGTLFEEVSDVFHFVDVDRYKFEILTSARVSTEHGRIESKEICILNADDALSSAMKKKWSNVKGIIRVRTNRVYKSSNVGVDEIEDRYFLTSITPDGLDENFANTMQDIILARWKIESRHWVIDVAFCQDRLPLRNKDYIANVTVHTKIAANVLSYIREHTPLYNGKHRSFECLQQIATNAKFAFMFLEAFFKDDMSEIENDERFIGIFYKPPKPTGNDVPDNLKENGFDALTEDDSPLSLFAKNRRKIKSKRIDR